MTLDREKYFFTPRYTRGEVSKVLGVTKDTLRHYEASNLISPYEDKNNKYKYYSIADLEILNVILFLRAMEVPVQDIPMFIECKNIRKYESFLDEQISLANEKISYWNNIKNILTYLRDVLGDYQKVQDNVKVVENTTFRFREALFDYKNYDIKKMAPKNISTEAFSNIIKLKIVGDKWLSSNREDTSDMKIGYLYGGEELGEDMCEITLPLALMITTLAPLEEIPKIITDFRGKYKGEYEFEENVYIIEHTFFNIFSQEALLRNIYFCSKDISKK